MRTILEKYQALARDDSFWEHWTDGLAILSSPGTFQIFELQRMVPELLVVAESFHLKPLLRDLAELVLCTKGEVVVVPKERMPSSTGVAATYRF